MHECNSILLILLCSHSPVSLVSVHDLFIVIVFHAGSGGTWNQIQEWNDASITWTAVITENVKYLLSTHTLHWQFA